jgi:glycerol-3-phosphate cytidylyltransferase-like family protein
MSTIVIMPGGFHPFHAGHMALYNSARKAFPNADLYVAATNSQETRPFPFAVKEKLAKVAGVAPGHFVQVKSPFQAKEITQNYNPDEDVLIFVRSEKDRNESPKPGGMKKDGTPAYFQPWTGKNVQPFSKHAYFAYLPTVEFGPGITSATEIRNAWPKLNDKRKTAMVMSLYPATQNNPKLAANVVAMLDQVMGGQENVAEDKEPDPITNAVLSFYKPVVNDIHKEKLPDYVDQARNLLQQTNDPKVRSKLIDIFKTGKENPYIQGGIVTTVGALLAGGVLSTAQSMGLSPAQTNLALQAILNTVIPTVVSRINGKNWADTIKYTLASAGVGTGIAGAGLLEDSSLSVEELAQISDKALDDAYHYGRSTPGANFGWLANLQSAKAAKRLIDAGETDIEKISDAIHQGWNVTAAADYKGQLQLDTPTPDEKKLKRAKLAMQSYSQLPEEEKEKDRVVARALLSALGGKVDEGFGLPMPGTYEQEHDMYQKQSGHRTHDLTSESSLSESADYLDEK